LNYSKNKIYAVLLALWIYIKPYTLILFLGIDLTTIAYIQYLLSIILFVIAFYINNLKINLNLCLFFFGYLFLVFFNALLVDYPNYVLIDGLAYFIIFLTPMFIISSSLFDFDNFIFFWYKLGIINTFLLGIYLFLMMLGLFSYGDVADLILPNIIIFGYITSLKKSYFPFFYCLTNVVAAVFWAGRMDAFSALITLFLFFIVFSNSKKIKIFVIGIVTSVSALIFINLNSIIIILLNFLTNYSINSRNFSLLENQISNQDLFSHFHLANRDIVYNTAIDYLNARYWLPGGFGIIRNLTNGFFYHPHNLFLELSLYFGVFGTLIFFIIIILKYSNLKKLSKEYQYKFLVVLGLFYFILSQSGNSFFTFFASILLLSILFFSRKKAFIN